jgi:hypothetical protein
MDGKPRLSRVTEVIFLPYRIFLESALRMVLRSIMSVPVATVLTRELRKAAISAGMRLASALSAFGPRQFKNSRLFFS